MGRQTPGEGQGVAERISGALQKKRKQNVRRRLLGSGLRVASLLSIAVLLLVVLYRYKDELSLDKFKQGLLVTEEYGGLSRLGSIADSTARYAVLGEGLAVASTEGIQYATRGGDGYRLDIPLSRPGITGGGQAFLAFDMNGEGLVSANEKGLLGQEKAGGKILTAGQNEAGFSAVIWEEQGYKSSVAAYDRHLKLLYLWRTPDYYSLAASVSEDGRHMAVAAVIDDGQGRISGKVLVFSLEEEGILAEISLGEALPLAVLASKGGYSVLTDQGVWALSTKGDVAGAHLFSPGEVLRGFAGSRGILYIWLENGKVSSKYSVVCLEEGAVLAGRLETGRDIKGISARETTVALLIGDDLQMYTNMQLEKIVTGRAGIERVFLLSSLTPVLMTGQDVYIP